MDRLVQNQRELRSECEMEQPVQGVSAQSQIEFRGETDDAMVAQMVAEVIAAKCAWVLQLDVMIKHDERDEPREILRLIRLEELKHVELLRGLALPSTGEPSAWENHEGVIGYNRAAQLKLKSSEFVRRIYYSFTDTPTRDILFEIICDDTNNAIRFTLLAMG